MTSLIIEVVVSPQGETRVETKGFVGSSCRQASEFEVTPFAEARCAMIADSV